MKSSSVSQNTGPRDFCDDFQFDEWDSENSRIASSKKKNQEKIAPRLKNTIQISSSAKSPSHAISGKISGREIATSECCVREDAWKRNKMLHLLVF